MSEESVAPSGAGNEAGACIFCGRTPSEVEYTVDYQNGDTVCPQCREYTNYNGEQ